MCAVPPEAVHVCILATAVRVTIADPDLALIAVALAGTALVLQALRLWQRWRR
jgi:hypothetical protein